MLRRSVAKSGTRRRGLSWPKPGLAANLTASALRPGRPTRPGMPPTSPRRHRPRRTAPGCLAESRPARPRSRLQPEGRAPARPVCQPSGGGRPERLTGRSCGTPEPSGRPRTGRRVPFVTRPLAQALTRGERLQKQIQSQRTPTGQPSRRACCKPVNEATRPVVPMHCAALC
jgi:hypothetical protein